MTRVVEVAGSMYTLARPEYGYRVGTTQLRVCTAFGIVSDGLVAFLHLAPPQAGNTVRILSDMIEQMAEFRSLASIPGRPEPTKIYGLQGMNRAFGQMIDGAQRRFPQLFELLSTDAYAYAPDCAGFTLDPRTGNVEKPPASEFTQMLPRVVGLYDPRYGMLQRLYDQGLLR